MVKYLLIPLLLLGTIPTMAEARGRDYIRPGGTRETKCFKRVYREEYVPGTRRSPGYVRRYTEKVRIPCGRHQPRPQPYYGPPNQGHIDDNSCIEGAVLGGIAGGALGAGLSRDEGNLIGIPLGIVGGALVGCQIDGG